MSPMQRSLKLLREAGYTCGITERWNAFAHIRQDLYGCIDFLACQPGIGIVGVQVTTESEIQRHMDKCSDEKRLKDWLRSGGKFIIHAWAKRKPRGMVRPIHICRRYDVGLIDSILTFKELP